MIDSMILWMKIRVYFYDFISSIFCLFIGLYEPESILRKKSLKMCVTKVWGFWGVNPGFTHFGGFRGYLGPGSYSL
jgi:hypothetical protein